MPPIYRSPEENFNVLQTCKDIPEARAFVATLTPRERIELNAVSTDLGLGTFYYPNTTPEEEADLPKPTQGHADRMYASLLEMVKSAQETARARNERLQLVIGEIRADRTSLMTTAMLVHICRRLGIMDMGVEYPPEGELMYSNRQIKYGLAEVKNQIKSLPEGRPLSEFGGATNTRQRRNFDFMIQLATSLGMRSFSSDPNGLVDDLEVDNPKIRAARVQAMLEVLDNYGDCIALHGKNRLAALSKSAPGIYRVMINTSNCYGNGDETIPVPTFRGFTDVTEDSEQAKRIGQDERTGASSLINVPIDGFLLMARDALQMARQADINVGEKLMPMPVSASRGKQR